MSRCLACQALERVKVEEKPECLWPSHLLRQTKSRLDQDKHEDFKSTRPFGVFFRIPSKSDSLRRGQAGIGRPLILGSGFCLELVQQDPSALAEHSTQQFLPAAAPPPPGVLGWHEDTSRRGSDTEHRSVGKLHEHESLRFFGFFWLLLASCGFLGEQGR